MQRVSPRTFLLGVPLAAALVAGLFVVFMLMGSQSAPTVEGIVNTNTPTPGATPTPKPNGLGPVGGLTDLDTGPGLFKCISWTESDSVTLRVKSAVQCYTHFPASLSGAEPPCDAVHTTGGGPTPVRAGEGNCGGHGGPPPYSPLVPTKGQGTYSTAAGGTVRIVACFEDIGGTLGPNAVAELVYTGADAFQAAPAGSSLAATVNVWLSSLNADCDAAKTKPFTTPSASCPDPGPPACAALPITITKPTLAAGGDLRDFDGDGCIDRDELLAQKEAIKCGDDPYNEEDAVSGSPMDVSGAYDIIARAVRNNTPGGGSYVQANAGFYYSCKADIQQVTKNLTARLSCYIDQPLITINPQVANCQVNPGGACASGHVFNCPPADTKFCGDGIPGASPPGCTTAAKNAGACNTLANQPPSGCPSLPCDVSQYQFADIDTKHTALTGTLDNTQNTIELAGCFEDVDGHGALGNVYVQAKLNAHTGQGVALTYVGQTLANCTGGTPLGGSTKLLAAAVRQEPGEKPGVNPRDSDGDGCPDKRELSDTAAGNAGGGLRDPVNRWDYFNPEKVNTPNNQSVSDILRTVQQFGKDQGNAAYTIDTDRTGLIGGNAWNLGPPDGQQRVTDILAAVKQFNHNCSKGP